MEKVGGKRKWEREGKKAGRRENRIKRKCEKERIERKWEGEGKMV